MKALITVLPEPYYQTIMSLWVDLEERFGFKHVFTTPIPHFTWQLGDGYDDSYVGVLEKITRDLIPFEVQTDIVTWFSADRPIVYLRVRKSEQLLSFHRLLWEKLVCYCENPSMLYSIATWEPHITLSLEKRSWLLLPEVRRFLATKDLSWTFKTDNICMVYQTTEKVFKVERFFPFGLLQ